VGVIIDSSGHLGTVRFLGAFQGSDQSNGQGERSDPCAQGGDVRYKHELDPEGIPQFGLVAEEAAKQEATTVHQQKQIEALITPTVHRCAYAIRFTVLNPPR
jgi:hypothetical protein